MQRLAQTVFRTITGNTGITGIVSDHLGDISMRRQTYYVTLAVLLLATASLLASEARGIGYRGDGSSIFPDAKPPTSWDVDKDLRWQATLPSWGHGSPIIVGDRVLVMVEPSVDCLWPQLLCLDLATGKQRWSAVIDPLEAAVADAGKRAKMEETWRHMRALTFLRYLPDNKAFDGGKRQAELEAMLDAAGVQGSDPKARSKSLSKAMKELKEVGLMGETWHDSLSRGTNAVGQAYATPVTDGTHVYIATALGTFAAFDLDGKRQWLVSDPGDLGEYCRNGRSPIIYKNLLISDITNRVRAFDRQTGKLVWSQAGRGDSIVSPNILTVGGKDILWASGCQAFSLPDGAPIAVEGWKSAGMQTLVKHDERDVVFFCGKGEHCGWMNKGNEAPYPPAAVRFALQGGKLVGTVLWHGIGGEPYGGNSPWMTYVDGRLLLPGSHAVEALTGKKIGGTYPSTDHLLLVAGGHVYGVDRGRNKNAQDLDIGVSTIDGKPVATMALTISDSTDDERRLIAHLEQKGNYPRWRWASLGKTLAVGPDCVVVRTVSRLYCFGK